VPEENGDLIVSELERFYRESLLVRTLTEDAELSQPGVDTGRMPTVAVPADEELMPATATADP
jgi:hypothetical protein